MKKNIMALAIASVFAAPIAMADAPTIYGQVSMGVEQHSDKDFNGDNVKSQSGTQVTTGYSGFGIKGSEDLGNGLTAVYKFGFYVSIDDGAVANGSSTAGLTNRNQYVGLAGGFGTVLMGRHDTPFKMVQGTDLFDYSTLGDIGTQAGGLGGFGLGGELRASNVLAYVSPSFGGVTIVGAFIPKETGGNTDKSSSLTDATSLAVMYGSKKEGLYLAGAVNSFAKNGLGYTNDDPLTTTIDESASGSISEMRLVAQYATGGLVANVMFQDFGGKAIEDTAMEGSTFGAGIAYQVGKFTPKLQIMQVDRKKDAAGTKFEDSLNYAFGLDYSLGKKTTLSAEYATLDNDGGANDTKAEQSVIAVGLTHKF